MSWTKTRSLIANTKRRDPDADVTELYQQLKAERAAEYISRVVDTAPPLSPSQRDRLALLLRSGAA